MKRTLCFFLIISMLWALFGCVKPEDKEAAATDLPATEAPATEAPATEAPATEAPAEFAPLPGKTIALRDGLTLAVREDGTVLADDAAGWRDIEGFNEWTNIESVATNGRLAVGVTGDGSIRTLVFADDPEVYMLHADKLNGASEALSGVTDAASVTMCDMSAAVVHRDGTVTYIPLFEDKTLDLSDWTEIVQAAVTEEVIYGLRADGTVLARMSYSRDRDTVKDWTGVKYITAMSGICVAVREDGSAISDWWADDTYKNGLSPWEDMVSVSGREFNVLGLKKDGTVEFFSYYEAVNGQAIYEYGAERAGRLDGVEDWKDLVEIEYDYDRAIGLKKDGTLVTAGEFGPELMEVLDWQGMTAFSAASDHVVGLRADGTVKAVGANDFCQCEVGSWSEITAVAAANGYTAGLKKDGTVVVACNGSQPIGQLTEVKYWRDVTAICAGANALIGLDSNGRVLIAGTVSGADIGYSGPGQTARLNGFSNIAFIGGGTDYVVCIKDNGKLKAVGYGPRGRYDFSSWKGLKAVSMKGSVCIGLKKDGTTLIGGAPRPYKDESIFPTGSGAFTDYVARISDWTDLKAVSAGECAFAGLKSDGTVTAEWMNEYMVRDVSGWTDIVAIDCAGCSVIGMRADGSFVGVGLNGFRESTIKDWSGIRVNDN
ncbi:MAG: hypothetical protein IKG85_08910 [Clostridia bacterium]|nr:hypothetical protein [Clostridia bacterium]